jgi:hypothetical protein
MPQQKLETLLTSREPSRPPRDPVKWGKGTQGDSEQALHEADHALETSEHVARSLPPVMSNGMPTDPIELFKEMYADPNIMELIRYHINHEDHADPGTYIDLDTERGKEDALQRALLSRKQ